MVLASNSGVIAAARMALGQGVAGSLSSGLHHARRERGNGFCTFNGLVIAAKQALAAGARSVLILDLDAHCGGGTHSLIAGDARISQLDVSVSGFDSYTSTEQCRLELVHHAPDYLPTISGCLDDLVHAGRSFDLCLYNAGMDPFEHCAIGGLAGITRDILAERERIVFEWCRRQRVPVAFVLAGGYINARFDESMLVDLHRLTLLAAAAAMTSRSEAAQSRST
jgi:acetoin utilization deacetylase AcuC-like enzyme